MTADSIRDQVARVVEDSSGVSAVMAGLIAGEVLALPLVQAVAHEAWDRGYDDGSVMHPDPTPNPYPLTGPDPLDAVRAEAAADALDELADGFGLMLPTPDRIRRRAAQYRAGTR